MFKLIAPLTLVFLLTGCASARATATNPPTPASSPTVAMTTITGDIALLGGTNNIRPQSDPTACNGIGKSSDVAKGATLTITDPSGKVIGLAALGAGAYSGMFTCKFPITSGTVPVEPFYGLQIGTRPVQHATAAQVDGTLEWTINDMG